MKIELSKTQAKKRAVGIVLLLGILLCLFAASTFWKSWVLVRSLNWSTHLNEGGKPNPWRTPHGKDGMVEISQHSGFLRFSYAPPVGKPWAPCQSDWTTFINAANPASWCDPQTLRPTPVEAMYVKNVNLFSEKRLKAKFVMRADAPAQSPLTAVPIMWQWWYIHNYRIFSCEPVKLHSMIWTTVECILTMPTTRGLVGPKGEDYTGFGVDFTGPFGGTFDISTLEVYELQVSASREIAVRLLRFLIPNR